MLDLGEIVAGTALAILSSAEEKGRTPRRWHWLGILVYMYAGKSWLVLTRGFLLSALGMAFCKTGKLDRWVEDA